MPVSYGKGDKKKAIKLHSELVRNRMICQRCGVRHPTRAMYDCAHIIPRRYSRTVTLLDNAWCACRSCHRRLDQFGDEKMALVAATIGFAKYEELKVIAEDIRSQKVDWAVELERLREIERTIAA
jgi:hypothetical protein